MIIDKAIRKVDSQISEMAENLIGSEIIKIAGEVNDKIKNGEKVFNLTIGDFDPSVFPIPELLKNEIINAYQAGATNYPAANGVIELRKAVSQFISERQNLSYSPDEILIAGGARPLIYGLYKTILDPGDSVIFPVPSWNNNHYCHLSGAKPILVETLKENNFMPTAKELAPHIGKASLLTLCSPLNPTGTVFTKAGLEEICDLVIEENRKRKGKQKPLYVMYDQIYWVLTYGNTKHENPMTLRPEMREYTIFVDGISKAFAATGVRVGWAFGPTHVIDRMKAILSHIGAWAPKAEQLATAKFLTEKAAMDKYLVSFKENVDSRLQGFYNGFAALKKKGFRVDAIAPQAAIYLTVKLDLAGQKTKSGKTLLNSRDVTAFLLDEAGMALVPFYAFGSSDVSPWYRLSVGACRSQDIPDAFVHLEKALSTLS